MAFALTINGHRASFRLPIEMFSWFLGLSIAFVFISNVLGCAPGPTPTKPPKTTTTMMTIPMTTTTPRSNERIIVPFSMEIFPPTAWSYPSKGLERNDLQAEDKQGAKKKILSDMQKEINGVLLKRKLSSNVVNVDSIDGVPLLADVVHLDENGQCSAVSADSYITSNDGKTISEKCDQNSGRKMMDAIKVNGMFVTEKEIFTADEWTGFAEDLQNRLISNTNVVFPEGKSIVINPPRQENGKTARFTMEVMPPAMWSYPSRKELLNEEYQKKSIEESRQAIKTSIENSVKRVLKRSSIKANVQVEIDESVDIQADVVDFVPPDSCVAVSVSSVLLDSELKTIVAGCDTNTGKLKDFKATINGIFETNTGGNAEVIWKILRNGLTEELEKENVLFPYGKLEIAED